MTSCDAIYREWKLQINDGPSGLWTRETKFRGLRDNVGAEQTEHEVDK